MRTYTAVQYAEMVIREVYKVENLYNLASAIGYTATKISIWASKKAEISMWASIDEEHAARNATEWKIADTKFRAYLIAFNTLSAKLPEFTEKYQK
jgi:hypothetical protein